MRVKEFMELYSDSNFHFMTSKGYLFLNSDQVKSIFTGDALAWDEAL